ncbi:MAG: hypothetical protein ACREBU_10850 [Nitrososphaera sp.]
MEDEYISVRKSKLLELKQAVDEYGLLLEGLRNELEQMKKVKQES